MMTQDSAIRESLRTNLLMESDARENADWLNQLLPGHPRQAEAIESLRVLLLRGALYTFSRSLPDVYHLNREAMIALAEDCAQEALIAVLRQLDTFRGESRFTTWVYKFAVNKALEAARRERWKDRSIDLHSEEWEARSKGEEHASQPDHPGNAAAQAEIWEIIQQVICEDLTERQRQIVRLIIFDEIPMDVVTERLKTNRNAVYKVLHDARKRIRSRLLEHGFSTGEVLELFRFPSARDDQVRAGGDCQ